MPVRPAEEDGRLKRANSAKRREMPASPILRVVAPGVMEKCSTVACWNWDREAKLWRRVR